MNEPSIIESNMNAALERDDTRSALLYARIILSDEDPNHEGALNVVREHGHLDIQDSSQDESEESASNTNAQSSESQPAPRSEVGEVAANEIEAAYGALESGDLAAARRLFVNAASLAESAGDSDLIGKAEDGMEAVGETERERISSSSSSGGTGARRPQREHPNEPGSSKASASEVIAAGQRALNSGDTGAARQHFVRGIAIAHETNDYDSVRVGNDGLAAVRNAEASIVMANDDKSVRVPHQVVTKPASRRPWFLRAQGIMAFFGAVIGIFIVVGVVSSLSARPDPPAPTPTPDPSALAAIQTATASVPTPTPLPPTPTPIPSTPTAVPPTPTPVPEFVQLPQDPGENFPTALSLTIPASGVGVKGSIGGGDSHDVYEIVVERNSRIRVSLMELSGNVGIGIVSDLNGSGFYDEGVEIMHTANVSGNGDELIVQDLPPGTYYFWLWRDASAASASYTMVAHMDQLESLETDSGPETSDGLAIEVGDEVLRFSDVVGDRDETDYYLISLTESRRITASISGLTEDADLWLYADLNGSGLVDSGENIQDSQVAGVGPDMITQDLVPGDYFLRVVRERPGMNTAYSLEISSSKLTTESTDEGTSSVGAMQIELAATELEIVDTVGDHDDSDYFRFTLDKNLNVRASLSGLSEDADLWLYADINDSGVVDSGENIHRSEATGTNPDIILQDLVPGTYFVRVLRERAGMNTAYTLNLVTLPLESLPEDGGDTPLGGIEVVLTEQSQSFSDVVGDLDLSDYYTFTLIEPKRIRASITGMTEDADLWLYADLDDSGLVESGENIAGSEASGTSDDSIAQDLPPGTYFLRVLRERVGMNTSYRVSMSAEVLASLTSDTGVEASDALDVILTSTAQVYSDVVGDLDHSDYYRFTVVEPGTLRASITGLTEDADIWLYLDANESGVIDRGEDIQSSQAAGAADDSMVLELEPGIYYLRVLRERAGMNTAYTLSMSISAS